KAQGTRVAVVNNVVRNWGGDPEASGDQLNVLGIGARSEWGTISGNILHNVHGADDDGVISVKAAGRGLDISGNVIVGCAVSAIRLTSSSTMVRGNHIVDNTADFCITLRYGAGNIVCDNIIENSGYIDIRSGGGHTVQGNEFINAYILIRANNGQEDARADDV